jgi:phage internal scaffolding protein
VLFLSVTIHSVYAPPEVPGVVCGQSRTQQHFKAECDINTVVERYLRTGLMPQLGTPMYGDFTNVVSYQEAQDAVIAANAAFETLPSKVRERFSNNPGKLLEFLADEANKDEAVKLGLIEPPPAVEMSTAPAGDTGASV